MSARATIPGFLEERAAEMPDAIALVAPGREPLTYRALDDHVRRTTERLTALGLGPSDRVAVLHRNGPELATIFVSVASVATCAPLNPAYREPELDFYLADLDPRALLVEDGLASPARDVARRRGIPVVEIKRVAGAPAGLFTFDARETGARSAVPSGEQ